MDNNTLIAIIFVSGTFIVLLLRVIINKSMYNFNGVESKNMENFDSNQALLINSIVTFLMFIAILTYDGCTKDLKASYEAEYKIKYENFDEYIKKQRLEAKEDALEEIRKNLNTPKIQ